MKEVKVFTAPSWCGPCKAYKETYEKLAEEFDNVIIYDVDDSEHQEYVHFKKIKSLPTTIFFNEKGVEVDRQQGVLTYGDVAEFLLEDE